MRAFAVPEFNGTGSVMELPMPQPGEGEILVRVRAAGVNPIDPFAVSGAMQQMVPHRLPLVPRFDYAGVVELQPGPHASGRSGHRSVSPRVRGDRDLTPKDHRAVLGDGND